MSVVPDPPRLETRDWDSLIVVAAHELRQPLHLMRLALERHFPNRDDPGRQVLERHIDRMARIVTDLAAMARIDQDSIAPPKRS
jgi:signal transduction histidine kinase